MNNPPNIDIRRDDVLEARRRIKGYVRETPLLRAEIAGIRLWLKCEFMQHAGVFKTRGAFNRQLSARECGDLDPATGIVVASGGNAGLANAYVAQRLGVKATVFVPVTAPRAKIDRLAEYGTEVHRIGSEYADAYEAASDYESTTGALFCHAYDPEGDLRRSWHDCRGDLRVCARRDDNCGRRRRRRPVQRVVRGS